MFECDNKFHCNDYSDERDCSLVDLSSYYDASKPPTPADIVQEGAQVPHTIIAAHVTILSILDINDVDSFFKVFFSVELVW